MGEAREVMDRITAAAFSNDLDALKALYAADAIAETPDQGTISGPDAIAAYLGEFMSAFRTLRTSPAISTSLGPLPSTRVTSSVPTRDR